VTVTHADGTACNVVRAGDPDRIGEATTDRRLRGSWRLSLAVSDHPEPTPRSCAASCVAARPARIRRRPRAGQPRTGSLLGYAQLQLLAATTPISATPDGATRSCSHGRWASVFTINGQTYRT